MTSNNSYSNSVEAKVRTPQTYEELLADLPKLRRIVLEFREPQWQLLEEWLWVERQAHLELSVEELDPDVANTHRVIARWLKHFLTRVKEEMTDRSRAKPVDEDAGENAYMEISTHIDLEGNPVENR